MNKNLIFNFFGKNKKINHKIIFYKNIKIHSNNKKQLNKNEQGGGIYKN